MRVLPISNSGQPYLDHCRVALGEFLGPGERRPA
jgi:hypothetical protein